MPCNDETIYNPILDQVNDAYDTLSDIEAAVLPSPTPSTGAQASKATQYKAAINQREQHYKEFNESLEILLHIDAALADYVKTYKGLGPFYKDKGMAS